MMPRVHFKVTEFDKEMIRRDMFETKKAYEYFLAGFDAAVEIQKLKDTGHVILDDGEALDSKCVFNIAFDEYDGKYYMPRLGPSSFTGSMTMWLGATLGNIPNTVFVYKADLKDAFGKITYIKPTDQKKLNVNF